VTDSGAESADDIADTSFGERDQLAEKIHSTDGVTKDQARMQIVSFEDQVDAMDDFPDAPQCSGPANT
jgi:hypothetical protein